jgi:AcrR family transcriptional regulator
MADETLTKTDRTRQAIIDAAYQLIIEQGYAATSMRQIAAQAGMSPGSLYNHFPSKQDLFSAILSEKHPFLQILPILNSVEGDNVEEFARRAAHTLVDQLGHHSYFLNLALTEIVEFNGIHVPELFARFLPQVLPLGERLGGMDGRLRDIPPFVLARAFLGMFFAYYITGILMRNFLTPEMEAQSLDHFVDIFLHGVLVKETI